MFATENIQTYMQLIILKATQTDLDFYAALDEAEERTENMEAAESRPDRRHPRRHRVDGAEWSGRVVCWGLVTKFIECEGGSIELGDMYHFLKYEVIPFESHVARYGNISDYVSTILSIESKVHIFCDFIRESIT